MFSSLMRKKALEMKLLFKDCELFPDGCKQVVCANEPWTIEPIRLTDFQATGREDGNRGKSSQKCTNIQSGHCHSRTQAEEVQMVSKLIYLLSFPRCYVILGIHQEKFWLIWFINQRAVYNHALCASFSLPSVIFSCVHFS